MNIWLELLMYSSSYILVMFAFYGIASALDEMKKRRERK